MVSAFSDFDCLARLTTLITSASLTFKTFVAFLCTIIKGAMGFLGFFKGAMGANGGHRGVTIFTLRARSLCRNGDCGGAGGGRGDNNFGYSCGRGGQVFQGVKKIF